MESVKDRNKQMGQTAPRIGLVEEVRKEWIVHEDEALAHRLQNQEIEAHYGGNRHRNRVVREDHPTARKEQAREIEEALAIRNLQEQIIKEQESADAAVARRLADELEREESEQRRITQIRDEQVAKRMQDMFVATPASATKSHYRDEDGAHGHRRTTSGGYGNAVSVLQSRSSEGPRNLKQQKPLPNYSSFTHGPENSGQKSTSPTPSRSTDSGFRSGVPQSGRLSSSYQLEHVDLNDVGLPLDGDIDEDDQRHFQEERDAELARLLQEVEHRKSFQRRNGQSSTSTDDQFDRDRMLAIEVQDRELARILQEKERARLKRAKERARLKSSAKREEGGHEGMQPSSSGSMGNREASSPVQTDVRSRDFQKTDQGAFKSQRQDLNSVELASPGTSNESNIAMAIDPTYRSSTTYREREFPRSHPPVLSSTTSTYSERRMDEEECEAPPYMPIAGQRRSLSLEKKKRHRDGCKAQ